MKHNTLKYVLMAALFTLIVSCAMGLRSQPAINVQDLQEIHCKHFIYGIPLGTSSTNDLIIRDIYALSNNDTTKFADWVAYRIDTETIGGDAKTNREYKADPWLAEEETLEPADYDGANKALKTDRGHLAPLASFKGTKHWNQTNYLSNITPQRSRLNRGLWRVLEGKVRNLTMARNTAYVLTGPLYKRDMPKLPGADENHKIPSGYWKIIIYQDNPKDPSKLQTAAFIFPQDTPKGANIDDYIVAIDDVEKRSGLDVLWELPDELEGRVESGKNVKWVKGVFYQFIRENSSQIISSDSSQVKTIEESVSSQRVLKFASNCQGCCSWHGGVCCIDGVTKCCDGTPLSQKCLSKGCDKCGKRILNNRSQIKITEESAISCTQKEYITPEEAQNYIGKVKTVCGTVVRAKYAIQSRGQPTFLNLNYPYPDHVFTVVIWGSHRHKFGRPEKFYNGKRICVEGKITAYHGKPQIKIEEKSQIRIKAKTSSQQ